MQIEYITSNAQKFEEAKSILHDWQLERVDIDLTEIQGTKEEIVQAKSQEALRLLNRPLIVEDVSLYCSALNGLPGPYIKEFMKRLGDQGFYELLAKYDNASAEVFCSAAYIEPGSLPAVFEGSIKGKIVAPKGKAVPGSYSWNRIFQPEGHAQTFADMDLKTRSQISMRYIALNKLKNYLEAIKRV